MNNKIKTYTLLAIVLVIWGIIGYQILSSVNPEEPNVQTQDVAIQFNPNTDTKIDTFSIQTTTRDPFLGTLTQKRKSKGSPSSKKKIEPPIINTPQIAYGGMVKKQNSSAQQVFVVNIDNQQYLAKKGQQINDVTIVRGNAKHIVIRFNNTTQTIPVQ